MLPVRKKRILNEAAGIRTFLLQFGSPFRHAKGFCTRTVLEDTIVARFLSHLCDRTICVKGPSGPSSAPAGATFPSAAGSAAPDGSGRKIRSRTRFPTAEAGSHEACAPLDPAV